VCVTTDAPNSGRLGIVAIDTLASGSIAADLMGRFLGNQEGTIAITLFDLAITEHAEKYAAFDTTLRSFYPQLRLLKPVEDHGMQAEAYCKCRELFEKYSDLAGIYVTTEDSMPVLKAARDAKVLERLTIITTDLFPDLVSQIRSGAVAATIYQRPRTQGRMSFRMLYKFLSEGDGSAFHQIALAPHLVMRGNLDFFLQRQSEESVNEKAPGNGARPAGKSRLA
jgi:LacI family transcriptional regulator